MTASKKILSLVVPVALLSLGACATPFKANVARFQAMPAPQGQSFTVQASDMKLQGGLEFAHYADLVTRKMVAQGYQPAASPRDATLLVTLDYEVDNGRERVESAPGTGFGFGYADPFYRPWYGRWGPRRAYRYGWYDPFMFGPPYSYDVSSYTIYTSELDMRIDRTADGQRLFEGKAKALSRDDDLTRLVPNLIDAMFTGFPGNSGETVRITVAPEEGARRR
ncbi:MAG: lipoprotein transmembrane [Sphingomonas sp. SCN 67-18]|mgnify:CR=1|uniref:DUF4136 domain-containing protein n=1 Tax=uncultured Sphingomonas sp. TaxID=158754 RepID=UPI0008690698|nr:DUF4136 domain-containing protein [Sphingomonas sp. SCN 67-18]ODU21709.1 MAG: lipoprotein transmembrane [Sphingomonas sp. SCN 67-18]